MKKELLYLIPIVLIVLIIMKKKKKYKTSYPELPVWDPDKITFVDTPHNELKRVVNEVVTEDFPYDRLIKAIILTLAKIEQPKKYPYPTYNLWGVQTDAGKWLGSKGRIIAQVPLKDAVTMRMFAVFPSLKVATEFMRDAILRKLERYFKKHKGFHFPTFYEKYWLGSKIQNEQLKRYIERLFIETLSEL